MRQVGLTTLDSPRGYGPALTLGGADITLQDLTYAYSVLANGGVMRGQEALEPHGAGERTLDPVALLRVTDAEGIVLYDFQAPVERRVVGENFVYLVTSIISDPETQCHHLRQMRRARTGGTAVRQEDGHERALRELEEDRRDMDLRLHARPRRRDLGRATPTTRRW